MKKLNKEKKILHNIDNNISSEKNFEDYLQNKDEINSIQVNEHQHGLVYILFNFFIGLYLQNLCYYLIVKPFYYYFNKKILKYLDTFLFLLNIDIRLDL